MQLTWWQTKLFPVCSGLKICRGQRSFCSLLCRLQKSTGHNRLLKLSGLIHLLLPAFKIPSLTFTKFQIKINYFTYPIKYLILNNKPPPMIFKRIKIIKSPCFHFRACDVNVQMKVSVVYGLHFLSWFMMAANAAPQIQSSANTRVRLRI